ncbi:MAG: tetratricopeptide repeat protein [Gallionellaceae bacterium]
MFDDLPYFTGNTSSYSVSPLFLFDLRGLPYASLNWTAAIFSDAVTHFFHLGNLLLHVANVILLFFLLRRLIGEVKAETENSSTLIWGAWFGALFFAIHPVAVYAVGYVVERSILMATLFSLLMQLAYLRGLLSRQKRWLAFAVAAYFLACFSKEHSLMMPAVLAAQTILLRTKIVAIKRDLWVSWIAFFVIAVLVMLRAKGVFGTPYEAMAANLFEQHGIIESTPVLHLLSVLTQAGLFFKYLWLWLLPNPAWMSIDMRESFVSSVTAWQGWLGLVGFVVYGYVAIRLLLRGGATGLAGFALLYPWLQFVVEFSSIRVQEPFVLYRSYLWLPGMMLVIPLWLNKLPSRRTIVVLSLVALLFIPLTLNRLWVFADNYRLWNDAARLLQSEREPGADRIFYNRGQAEMVMGKMEGAIADFQRAAVASPQLTTLRYQLGIALVTAGRCQEAIAEFEAQIAIKPDEGRAYYGKGLALMGLHEKEQASRQMERGCELGNEMACTMVAWRKSIKTNSASAAQPKSP